MHLVTLKQGQLVHFSKYAFRELSLCYLCFDLRPSCAVFKSELKRARVCQKGLDGERLFFFLLFSTLARVAFLAHLLEACIWTIYFVEVTTRAILLR